MTRPLADIDRDIGKAGRDLGRAYSQERGAVADQRRLLADLSRLSHERQAHAPDEEARRCPRWKPSRRAPSSKKP